ncbi:MAG: type II toxin-antitoxin system VapC family toxin [Defluviitaleaceae bacterium]|nr:type II toxin-antitoxin system VapC family toxin [Defluviitaleaceae bacterium]
MKYMLDTNTCIFLMKNFPDVVTQFKEKRSDGVVISSITASELYFGIHNSKIPEQITVHLANFLIGVPVADYTAAVADCYGKIRAELKRKNMIIGELDTLIAAHAKSENLVLVTNNTREFERVIDLKIEDWRG